MRRDRVGTRVGRLAIGVLALTTAWASPVRAAGRVTQAQETVVYPTGDPAQDVENVRAAVRGGRRVLLKATDLAGNPQVFHFGDFPIGAQDYNDFGSGWVALGTAGEIVPVAVPFGTGTAYISLGNDVQLVGETIGGAKTTIRGGTSSVRNWERRNIPGIGVRFIAGLSNLRIEGIRFTESVSAAIEINQFNYIAEIRTALRERGIELTLEVARNEFIDVKPALSSRWFATAALLGGTARTDVRGNDVHFTDGKYDAAERAYEKSFGLAPRSEQWAAFSISNLSGAGTIVNNRVDGSDVGLVVFIDGSQFVRVAENTVRLRPEGSVGIGLLANHTYLVERNTVVAPGTNPDGIFLWATDPAVGINGSTVRHNRVVMDGSWFGAISFVGPGRNNYFAENRVEGSAAYAFGLVVDFVGAPAPPAENAFAGNNLALFRPIDSPFFGSGAHVFFDMNTHDNVFAGYGGIVKDLGVNNSITGTLRRGDGPGQQFREALKKRQELLWHFRDR